MIETHKNRLRKLAKALRNLPKDYRFDLGKLQIKTECGTVGCAIGLTPFVFPRLVKKREDRWHGEWWTVNGEKVESDDSTDTCLQVAKLLFDINWSQAKTLFTGDYYARGWQASATDVADEIDCFLKEQPNTTK